MPIPRFDSSSIPVTNTPRDMTPNGGHETTVCDSIAHRSTGTSGTLPLWLSLGGPQGGRFLRPARHRELSKDTHI
eukprot:gene5870-biopygen2348